MKKLVGLFLVLLLWPVLVFSSPDQTMSISPSATAGAVIEASDENSRSNSISVPYNAHTHNDLTQTTSTTFLFASGTGSGTNMTLKFGNSTNVPAIRWQGTLDAFQYTEDQSTWITLPMSQGTSGQKLESRGADNIPIWVDGDAHQSSIAKGSSSGPSTTSATYVDITDMSVTMTTTGNPVLIIYSGSFDLNTTADMSIILDIDGSDQTESERQFAAVAEESGAARMSNIVWLTTPTAAEHIIKAQQKVSGGATLTNTGVLRTLTVVELK